MLPVFSSLQPVCTGAWPQPQVLPSSFLLSCFPQKVGPLGSLQGPQPVQGCVSPREVLLGQDCLPSQARPGHPSGACSGLKRSRLVAGPGPGREVQSSRWGRESRHESVPASLLPTSYSPRLPLLLLPHSSATWALGMAVSLACLFLPPGHLPLGQY